MVLEGEFSYNTVTGKNDIDFWEKLPDEFNDLRSQFLFYEGTSFISHLETALDRIHHEPQKWRDIPSPKPPDPRPASEANIDSTAIYNEACDFAYRLELGTAERLFQRLVNSDDPDFADDAHNWIIILREYDQILRSDAHKNTQYKIPGLWGSYVKQFPKPFTPLFDPRGFRDRYSDAAPMGVAR